MKHIITSQKEYEETMIAVFELMDKGEAALTENELNKLGIMTSAAEVYEDEVLGLKPTEEEKPTAASVKNIPKIFQDAVINDDLKRYKNDPIVRKKMERAIETLKKVKAA